MDKTLEESPTSPKDRFSSLTNLKKCLSLYSDPCSPTDDNPFPLQPFNKTMPTAFDSVKDSQDSNPPSVNQSLSGDFSNTLFTRLKRQNLLIKQENSNLLKEIQILNKNLKAKNEELRSVQIENKKMKKIVDYVIKEILGDFKDFEDKDELFPYLVKKINVIKATVVGTQRAFFKQKEINKKIRIENSRLNSENISNIGLILKLGSFKDNEMIEIGDVTPLGSFDNGQMTEKKHTRHKKSNSMYMDGKRENEFNEKICFSPSVLFG